MTLRAYRLVQTRHAETAFSGAGAASYPGRWNLAGDRVVYCAASLALAALEILVNVGKPDRIRLYSWFEVTFDESQMRKLEPLPQDWKRMPIPQSTRKAGHDWCISQDSAVLCVPSAVIPSEYNYILNTRHPGFADFSIGSPQKFSWDERLTP